MMMTHTKKLWDKIANNAVFYTIWEDCGENEAPTPLIYAADAVEQEDYIEDPLDNEAAVAIFDSESSAREHARFIAKQPNVTKPLMVNGSINEMMNLMDQVSKKVKELSGRNLRVDLVSIEGNAMYREVIMSNVAAKH